jgi:hydrogenase nickel incorporation protein HypA/HybF
MHEFSIATEIMGQLTALAEKHGVARYDSITIEAGELRQIVPEALETAFEAVSRDTVAQGAELRLVTVRPVVRCRGCGERFEPGEEFFRCPKCNLADIEIVEGNELILKSVEFEDNE